MDNSTLLEKAVQILVPQPCFDKIFVDLNFFDGTVS